MPLSVTRSDVKRKCMVASSEATYDSAIDALIAEMLPAIEHSLDPMYVQDTSNTGLQAELRLGALELIAAEFLAQRAREPGFMEELQVGGVRLGPAWERGRALAEQGSARLAPYQRALGAAAQALPACRTARATPLLTHETLKEV
ncbi:MAG: hypothetical protein KatS3mg024_1810 [Armatimonadota bacterium]|nr:MAG: hypothetical protein KatS3mg024_1810 [Armatimonadota bacterium]